MEIFGWEGKLEEGSSKIKLLSVYAEEVVPYWWRVGSSVIAWVYFISLKKELLNIWDFIGFFPTNESD